MVKIIKNNWLLFLLLSLDAAVVCAHFFLKNTYGFFNLDGEQNLNSTYSGLKLLGIAALAIVQFLIVHRRGEKFSTKALWLLVAASFLYLGTDEMIALHERVGFVVNNLLGVPNAPGASFRWMLYYAPFILFAIAVYVRFIFLLWREDRFAARVVLCGAALFVLGLGVEVVSGKIIYPLGVRSGDFSLYFISIIGEEIIELAGATLFLAGVERSVRTTFHRSFVYKKIIEINH